MAHQHQYSLAHLISLIFAGLTFVLLLILVVSFGTSTSTPFLIGLTAFFIGISFLIKRGDDWIGRIMLSTVPPLVCFGLGLWVKFAEPASSDVLYYDIRFFLVLLAIIPMMIFSMGEKLALYGSLSMILFLLITFDPIHNALDLGYYQRGFTGKSYYYMNYVAIITFGGIVGCTLTLKSWQEKSFAESQRLRNDLVIKNNELNQALTNIESQNEELRSFTEELSANKDHLMEANKIIERQKIELQKQVDIINKELKDSNDELLKHYNEIREFSYTISHNLRGPVATLLGLANLSRYNAAFESNQEAKQIVAGIGETAANLDRVVFDLHEIIAIRENLYHKHEHVQFADLWERVKLDLNISAHFERDHITTRFECPTIYCVKPLLISMLSNLVSNALKFRSSERNLVLSISTKRNATHTLISVSDNGRGIDLERHKDNLFKMYKRFHPDTAGKGLGLYVLKTQVEVLKGAVNVESSPGNGTRFEIILPNLY